MFTEPVSSGEQIPLHNFRIPLLIAAFCLVPGISVCGRGIDVRVVVPVRAATVVFVSLIAMAMMLAAIGPACLYVSATAKFELRVCVALHCDVASWFACFRIRVRRPYSIE
jgi:hypothetical protein